MDIASCATWTAARPPQPSVYRRGNPAPDVLSFCSAKSSCWAAQPADRLGGDLQQIFIGYACEPYIQQTSNRYLRRILAQFRTGSHKINIETGRHRKQDRKDRRCPMCTHRIINLGLPPEEFDAFDSDEERSDPIEDEHHAIFDCSAYADARRQYRDLFQSQITTVGDFLNQPQCHRLAKLLTWIRMVRMNRAWSDGSVPGPEQT